MRSLFKSVFLFGKGMWPAIVAAFALVSDPLKWPHLLGWYPKVNPTLGPLIVQTTLILFIFGWGFWWFHEQRVRIEDAAPPIPDMPLHKVFWYLAAHSQWSLTLEERDDDDWITAVAVELAQALALGRLTAFGRIRNPGENTAEVRTPIPSTVFERPKWDLGDMIVSTRPLMHVSRDGGIAKWARVCLNRRQVQEIWPPRVWHRRWYSQSPIDRINLACRRNSEAKGMTCKDIEKRQDEWYKRQPYLNSFLEFLD